MERVCPTATVLLEKNTNCQVLSAKIEELRPSLVVLDLCFPFLRDPIHKKILALQNILHFNIVYVTQIAHLRDYLKIFTNHIAFVFSNKQPFTFFRKAIRSR